MMKFSPANNKIKHLTKVKGLRPYLKDNKKVYSFDILSGVNCPYAKDCKSQAVENKQGKRHIQDGPDTDFRCFSASQEVLFTGVFNLRKENGKIVEYCSKHGYIKAADKLESLLPKNAGIIRIHVGGDFKTKEYFRMWLELARRKPSILFYAYTKSLPFWVSLIHEVKRLPNLVLTASEGGHRDDLIGKFKLRHVKVIPSVSAARKLRLPVDHDDRFAADPSRSTTNFGLLIHGVQPSGSKWGKAVKALKGKGSYGK
jgi:hypothetical protein